jgi:hypothetical protein
MVDLGWGLRFFFSNKFPGDADVAGLGTTLWEPMGYNNTPNITIFVPNHSILTW